MALVIKNNGSATFRGSNSCRVEFQILNTANGEVHRERKTFHVSSKTKAEKGRCIREFRAELESGLRRDAETTSFRSYSERWLSNRTVAPRTLAKERNRVRTINISLGDMVMKEITPSDIAAFKKAITTVGPDGTSATITGKPLSGTTARGTFTTLKQIFTSAVEDGYADSVPVTSKNTPKNDTKEKEALTRQQVDKFRAALDSHAPRASLVAIRLCLFAGLRRGEACGLEWRDFDEAEGVIHVRRAVCTETLEKKPPKTSAGIRDIPIDADTIAYLVRWRRMQREKLFERGVRFDTASICAKAGCEVMHPENLTRALVRFCESHNLPVVTPHILRHTFCTLQMLGGVDLKTVQYLMGHNDPSLILRTYAHVMKGQTVNANRSKIVSAMASMPEAGDGGSAPSSNLAVVA